MDLIEMTRRLEPFVVGTEGNTSQRKDYGFKIKGSGKSFRDIQLDDFIECDDNGTALTPHDRPSMESGLHALIYRENPEINYIAHTHPVNCLKIVCREDKIYPFAMQRFFPDQVVFNGRQSCIVRYAKPGGPLVGALSEAIDGWSGTFPEVFLLANHGIVCCGKTAAECVVKSEICEKAAEAFSFSNNTLTYKQMSDLLEDPQESYRKSLV